MRLRVKDEGLMVKELGYGVVKNSSLETCLDAASECKDKARLALLSCKESMSGANKLETFLYTCYDNFYYRYFFRIWL